MSTRYGIRSYSYKHRVRSTFPELVKPRVVGSSIRFAIPDRAVYTDSYAAQADMQFPQSFTYGSNTYEITINNGDEFTDSVITGRIVLNEAGNGINDYLLSKAILEAVPNSTWLSYDYADEPDPVFEYDLRSSPYVDTRGNNKADLVALNMNVKGGLNPFTSVAQTPVEYSTSPGDKVPFNGDDRYIDAFGSQWQGKSVESLILNAPLNTKFRRALFTFTSSKVILIRSVTLFLNEYIRKGFG